MYIVDAKGKCGAIIITENADWFLAIILGVSNDLSSDM